MANFVDVWYSAEIATNHSLCHLRPGHNRIVDDIAKVLLREKVVTLYKKESKIDSKKRKGKNLYYGENK